jgi:hypothetical protein
MDGTDTPLCVASNSNYVFVAALDNSQSYRGRPPAVVIYKSQQLPISLASIQWTSLSSVLINGPVSNYLPMDGNGYWCAANDNGAFAIVSGVKNTDPMSSGLVPPGHIIGLLYTPPPPSNNTSGGTIGGPAAAIGFTNVATNNNYDCIVAGQQCNGYLYATPSATGGASSNFVLAMYNSSGYSFEVLDGTTKQFTSLIETSVSSTVKCNPPGTDIYRGRVTLATSIQNS